MDQHFNTRKINALFFLFKTKYYNLILIDFNFILFFFLGRGGGAGLSNFNTKFYLYYVSFQELLGGWPEKLGRRDKMVGQSYSSHQKHWSWCHWFLLMTVSFRCFWSFSLKIKNRLELRKNFFIWFNLVLLLQFMGVLRLQIGLFSFWRVFTSIFR